MASCEQNIRQILDGKQRGLFPFLLVALLWLPSIVYLLVMRLRALCYRVGVLRSCRLNRPVISVGNITVGGTGKTPTVALLARLLMERGKRVCVLSRGYGGTLEGESHIVSNGKELLCTAAEAGDEPVLLATIVPGLMVVIGSDRYRAGLLAQEQLNLDIFILDDGFQHLRLTRDLNILLLDCQRPFGNGLTLPAGSLREPRSALSRADLVIFTRCQGEVTPACSSIAPALHSRHLLTGLSTLGSSELLPFSTLAGQRGLAFAGIADPSSFATALAAQGVELAGVFPLPDHVKYDDAVIKSLLDEQKRCGADFLITTEKDLVKLRPYGHLLPQLYAARLELELFHKGLLIGALEKLLSN